MPLLGKKVFQLAKPLTLIDPEETVYVIKHTGECFQSRGEYDKRIKLYRDKIWTCQCTGHINLTHEEAWKSEQDAHQMLKKTFPECMEKPVLEIVHHNTLSLDALIDQAYIRVNSVFFLGDQVQFKVKHGGRTIRGRISKIGSCKMESNCHSPCSDKENSEQTSTNNSEISPRKNPPKLLPYNYNVRLLDEDKIISSVPAEDLIRCERPPNKDLLRLFIRAHALRSGTSANSPWVVDPKLVKKHSLPSKFADFLLSYPRLSEEAKTNCMKKRKQRSFKGNEPSNFLPKKRLKVELKLVKSETVLHNYLKTVNSPLSGLKKENQGVSKTMKDKGVAKKEETTSNNILSTKTVSNTNEPQAFSTLDHSYSSPAKKQATVRCGKKVTKTASASGKNNNSVATSDKQTLKNKNKNAEERTEGAKSSPSLKLTKKIQEKKGNQVNPKKQKLKQITLFDLSAKKNKKASLKTQTNASPVKRPSQEASKSLISSPTKPKPITPAKLDLLIKKISSMRKEKNRNVSQYVDRLIKQTNPEQYSKLPDDMRILILRRIAWTEEKLKISKMNEAEKGMYLKEKYMMNRKKRKVEKCQKEGKDVSASAKGVSASAKAVSASAKAVSASAKAVSASAKAVSASANEVSTSANEVSTSAKEASTSAKEASTSAKEASTSAKEALTSANENKMKLKIEDKLLEIEPLSPPKLVPTPNGVPNELFGDAVMVVEFINCYSGLLKPDEPYPVHTDLLLKSIATGKFGFGYLSRILLILLQTLLQDQIAENYRELGVRLSDLPVNIYTSSELVRLCLRKCDYHLYVEDEKENEVPDHLLSLLEAAEIYDLLPEEKLKILSGLCHRIMNSYSVQEYMEQKQKMASQVWKEKFELIKKENEKRLAETKKDKEVNPKEEPQDNLNEVPVNGTQTDDVEKDGSLKNDDEDPENLISTLKRRRNLIKTAKEEKEKKMQEDREQRLRDAEEQKKQKQKDKFEEAIMAAKLALRQIHLGYDRNHSRYWLFSRGTHGLYLEKGWVGENVDYRVDCKEDPHQTNSDVPNRLPVMTDEAKNELSVPTSGQNLWFCYDTIKDVDLLMKSLSKKGMRESHLLKKLQKHYDEIVLSIRSKKSIRVEIKSSAGDKQILEGFKKELTETEVRLRKGVLGGVPNFDQWNDRLQKATSIKDLVCCLLETQANVLPRFLQGIMRIKSTTAENSDEEGALRKAHPNSHLYRWLESVETCATMSRLHVLLGVLDACIKWEKSTANAKCKICRKKDEDVILILCDNCNQAFHVDCLRPALTEVPDGDWICPACQPSSSRQNNRVEALQKRHQEEMKDSHFQSYVRSREQENYVTEDSCYTDDDEEETSEDEALMEECCLCGGDEDLIHCSRCRMGFHTFCHQPTMHNKPRGQWICNYCQTGKKNESIEKMRKKWQPWKRSSSNRKITRAEKSFDDNSTSLGETNPSAHVATRYRNKLQLIQKEPVDSREMRALRRAAVRPE